MNDQNALMTTRQRTNSDDNMIPLINIVFLLLIFFMVAGQIKAMPSPDLQLPESTLEHQPQASSQRLELAANGDIRLNGEVLSVEALTEQLQQLDAGEIALFADRRANAEQLTAVLQPLRQLEQLRVQLHTDVFDATAADLATLETAR